MMSIYRNNDRSNVDLSLYHDGELPPAHTEALRRELADNSLRARSYRRLAVVSEVLSQPVPEEVIVNASANVRDALARTLSSGGTSVRPLQWWQRDVSLPFPVLAAASVLFLVMALGLIFEPAGPTSVQRSVADFSGSDRPVQVQVQMDGDQSDLLVRWLEEQNQQGKVIIQLPESAEFQLRGEPVLLRPGVSKTEQTYEIVPLEVPVE